ncbi:43157_t:CDS:10 [Gigaspora margarita]|uniref:43157_t:CDS:1 n=1 Tax=Gigaspora margarita TaxID=4874 RepID=A0ABN7UXB1_GIGMA|nr:43157_t:CDS:10 [Gigaspora margarita]
MEPYIGNEAVLKYFETYDEDTRTYEHFLNELKETIITSPPYTDDWSGLDGAWYGRYTYHVNKDETNKPRMESFFQNIILEREKRNAGKNYVIEGVRVLNEARFRSSDEVISAVNKRYPEDQASGASQKRQCLQTENGSQTPEDKVAEVTDDEEWEFDTPQPSWLKRLIEERCLLISKDDPITTYKLSLKSIWWKIIDLSDPKIVDLLSESDLSDLNAMFSSALKDWTVLEPSAEKCLKSLSKLDSYQLRIIGESVRPMGTHGAILRLQEMTSTRNQIILEADDLFYDGYIDEDIKIFPEETSLLDHNDHLDPDVACEMIAKGIPNRQNSERDIDIFIKRHIFSCFDDILDSHFGEVVSRASRDRRANAVDAPSNAEGYHLDWMFTRHDLGKDLSWGREFSICERAGSKVENKRKVISNNLKGQKILRDMHRSLTEVISVGGDGMLSKPVLQSITKLLMPGFLSSYFVLRAILVIYVGGGYYASINLADFDIPTKYEELKSVIEISRIMLQVKKLLSTTITRFKLIKKRAEKEKLAPGRMIVPVREKDFIFLLDKELL